MKQRQSLLDDLQKDFPLLAPFLLTKLDDAEAIELVLRDNLKCNHVDLLQSLAGLGQQSPFGCCRLNSIFLYKDFLSNLCDQEQTQFYEVLGQSLGHQIEELSLSFIKLPVASLASLLRRMPNLKKLYLGRVSLLQKQDAAHLYTSLKNLSQLQEFHCSLAPALRSSNPLFQGEDVESMDDLLQSLAQIPTLQTLYLAAFNNNNTRGTQQHHIQQPACLQALSDSSVVDLTLMNCALTTTQHVEALVHCGSRSFRSLALINAQIGDDGAQVIVRECLLHREDANASHVHSTGAAGSLLLQKLYLPGNQLTDVGGNAIARALRNQSNCCSLQVLDLHDNHLTAQFGVCMGLSLQQHDGSGNNANSSLRFLDVSYNPLGDAGGIALACGIAYNTTLEQLNLFQNDISDKTCDALAAALQSNRHLKQLNLYHNPQIKNISSILHNLEHSNYVLERLEVQVSSSSSSSAAAPGNDGNDNDDSDDDQEAQLDFWLTLNRKFGRRKLLSSNTTDGQYLEKGLGQATNDLKSLFYFLKAKPTLCQQQSQSQLQPQSQQPH